MNKNFLIILSIISLIVLGIIYYFYFWKEGKDITRVSEGWIGCLDNKNVFYQSEDKGSTLAELTIFINDKLTENEPFSFRIDNVYKTVPRAELLNCNIYAIKFLNYDQEKIKQEPGFKVEIWKYKYNGEGAPFFTLSEKSGNNFNEGDYSYIFRIDPNEKYLVLEKSYLGKDDYSLVIKDINTKEDLFILFAKDISKQHSNMIGSIGLNQWTKDGRYFWGNIFEGAYVNGFFRIDVQTWKVDIFEAPQDVLGGDALNVENGFITVHPGNTWFGFSDMTEEEKEKRRKQGIGTELYIHNLITGERKFIVKTEEPLYFFKPKWISNTELQYELPNGEKKIYILNNSIKIYRNEKYRFEAEYPEGYNVKETEISWDSEKDVPEDKLGGYKYEKPVSPLFYLEFSSPTIKNSKVEFIIYNANSLNINEWIDYINKGVRQYLIYEGRYINATKSITISGIESIKAMSGCCMTCVSNIFIPKENKIYNLQHSGNIAFQQQECPSEFNEQYGCCLQNEDIFNQIISTFKFLK